MSEMNGSQTEQHEVTQAWDAHFRGLVSEEHEAMMEILAHMIVELRDEIAKTIRLAFLERGGWQPRICGTWDERRSYSALDIVMKDGTSWLAKHSDPGPCPGEGWQILSCKGERGKPGPMGAKGEQGEPGPQGERGADIIAWQINQLSFEVTPRMRDGSYAPSINLRPLFESYDRQVNGASVGKPPTKQTPTPRVEPPLRIEFVERVAPDEGGMSDG